MAEAHAESLDKQTTEAVPTTKPSLESLGLGAAFIRALQRAYPNMKAPTDTQAQLIPAILGTQDILLKDVTGSGKCVFFFRSSIWCLFSTCLD
jgi:superfamily II DNA/RNA helicase